MLSNGVAGLNSADGDGPAHGRSNEWMVPRARALRAADSEKQS
jgi:hypothetical protein